RVRVASLFLVDCVDVEGRYTQDGIRGVAPVPSEQCANARQQLAEREGFGEIVVRTAVEPGDAVIHRVASSQHQHRHVDVLRTQLVAQAESIELGQHDV